MPWKPSCAALAALLLGLSALPARADERATLRVTVRVVETCEIRVPDRVWDHVLKDRAKQAISQRCRGRGPARVDFDPPGPPPWTHGGRDHGALRHGRDDRHHGRDRDDDHREARRSPHHDPDHRHHARDRDHRDDDRGSRTVWVTITY